MSKAVIFILIIILFPKNYFCQNDTTINPSKIILKPSFFGVQFEAISSIVSSELGVLVDYDIYSSINSKHNFGFRLSAEYYDFTSLDVGGKTAPGPFGDFNIYGRHSIRGKHFWFSPLIGLSLHNSINESTNLKIIIKWGLELKYNLFDDNIGLLLKFASSFYKNSGYRIAPKIKSPKGVGKKDVAP